MYCHALTLALRSSTAPAFRSCLNNTGSPLATAKKSNGKPSCKMQRMGINQSESLGEDEEEGEEEGEEGEEEGDEGEKEEE